MSMGLTRSSPQLRITATRKNRATSRRRRTRAPRLSSLRCATVPRLNNNRMTLHLLLPIRTRNLRGRTLSPAPSTSPKSIVQKRKIEVLINKSLPENSMKSRRWLITDVDTPKLREASEVAAITAIKTIVDKDKA